MLQYVYNSDNYGSCTILLSGDNRSGNLGYRDTPTSISDNGTIDRVATDWKEQQ
jgi:hypothetical protein